MRILSISSVKKR